MSERNEGPSAGTPAKFGARSTALEVIAGHDLRGREAIVTGGASGIGVETVRALATAGARVVLAARDRAKAESVVAALRKETGSESIEFAMLDLGSLASVAAFVNDFLAKRRALDLLINNAGIMATPLAYTVDGFESQFGTNHIGHFGLTVGLLPALKAARKSRVVSLTSLAHRRSDLHFEDLNFRKPPYDPWSAYGQSKTAKRALRGRPQPAPRRRWRHGKRGASRRNHERLCRSTLRAKNRSSWDGSTRRAA